MAAPTITTLGSCTTQITLNQSTFIELKDAVKNAITGGTIASSETTGSGTTGWELMWEGYLHPISKIYHQLFRGLCKDGVTHKIAILRWNLPENELWVNTCEYINLTGGFNLTGNTLSAIAARTINYSTISFYNEAYTWYNCSATPFKMDACDLLINVDARHLLIQSYINSEPGPWQGIFEIQRNDPKDTGASGNGTTGFMPCYGFIGSTLWTLGVTNENPTSYGAGQTGALPLNTASSTRQYPLICMPSVMKSTGKATGINACLDMAADFGIAQWPNWFHKSVAYNASFEMPPFPILMGNSASIGGKFQFSGWDTTKKVALPISIISDYGSYAPVVLGQIYGLKVIGPSGQNMNKMKLTVDSDGAFSGTGTEKDHFILNLHFGHGYDFYNHNSSSHTELTSTLLGTLPGNSTYPITFAISIGSAYLVGQSSYVYKINAFNGVTTSVSTGSTARCYKFDGERYLYIGTDYYIYRIDVYDLSAYSVYAGGGGKIYGLDIIRVPGSIDAVYYTTSTTGTVPNFLKVEFVGNTSTSVSQYPAPALPTGYTLGAVTVDAWGNVIFQATTNGGGTYPARVMAYYNNNTWYSSATGSNYNLQYHVNSRLIDHNIAYTSIANGNNPSGTLTLSVYSNIIRTDSLSRIADTINGFSLYMDNTNILPPFIYRFFGTLTTVATRVWANASQWGGSTLRADIYGYGSAPTNWSVADSGFAPTGANMWTMGTDGIRMFIGYNANCTQLRVITGFGNERVINLEKMAQIAVVA